jgi:putative sporulation protein YtaF
MHFIYILLIALANNLDNIGVRIAYSIRGIKISNLKNLWISVITFIISSLAALSGTAISFFLSRSISSFISMLLLTAIGVWIIIEPYIKKKDKNEARSDRKKRSGIFTILKRPEKADMDDSKEIDFKEATFLGIALSVNNIGGGLSAGMIGLNYIFIGLFSAVISFLALWSGNYIARFLNKWNIGDKATVISGVLLILIGIKQVIW